MILRFPFVCLSVVNMANKSASDVNFDNVRALAQRHKVRFYKHSSFLHNVMCCGLVTWNLDIYVLSIKRNVCE